MRLVRKEKCWSQSELDAQFQRALNEQFKRKLGAQMQKEQ